MTSSLEREYRAITREYDALSCILSTVKDIRLELMRSFQSLREKRISSREFAHKLDDIQLRLEDLEKAEERVNLFRYRAEDYSEMVPTRRNNVVITGIPQVDGEDLNKIISKLAQFVNYQVDKTQILRISRKKSRDENQLKPIIVVFRYRDAKKQFMKTITRASNIATLTPRSIGLPGNNKITVSDHLTKEKKLLIKKAKIVAARRKYNFVWVRNGKLYVRKTMMSKIIQIKTEDDLEKMY